MTRPPALNADDLHAQGLPLKTARDVQAYVDYLERLLADERQQHQDQIEDVATLMNDCMPSPHWGLYD